LAIGQVYKYFAGGDEPVGLRCQPALEWQREKAGWIEAAHTVLKDP
jgi:hypothetical protein